MRQFTTEKRLEKITRTIKSRQQSLHLVLENIHDPHNVSAIFRSCDAVGIPDVSLLYHVEDFPKVSRITSSSAVKWVDKERYTNVDECFGKLKAKGFKIYTSMLDEKAVPLHEIDFTEKVAIVMGNEHRGASERVAELSDATYYIPMMGMIQSLNVSVAAAVTLYEAMRQRKNKGMYDESELSEEQIEKTIDDWCER